jgi:hypothetical protein
MRERSRSQAAWISASRTAFALCGRTTKAAMKSKHTAMLITARSHQFILKGVNRGLLLAGFVVEDRLGTIARRQFLPQRLHFSLCLSNRWHFRLTCSPATPRHNKGVQPTPTSLSKQHRISRQLRNVRLDGLQRQSCCFRFLLFLFLKPATITS